MKNWIMDSQNLFGIICIVASGAAMVIFGHGVFGELVLTDKLNVPYAALPMAFGFLIMKTDLAANINALRGKTPQTPPPAGGAGA